MPDGCPYVHTGCGACGESIMRSGACGCDGVKHPIGWASTGERLQAAWNKLRELGVGYRKALDGKFHAKFDHSGYVFEMRVDRQIEIGIRCAAGDDEYVSIAAAAATPHHDLLGEQLEAVERAIVWIEALPENPCIEMVCEQSRDEDVSPYDRCARHAQEWQAENLG